VGIFKNPEQLAYSLNANEYGLYRVRFKMTELWDDYTEGQNDTLDAEVFAHWIEEIKNAA
jgi:nitrile hydratase